MRYVRVIHFLLCHVLQAAPIIPVERVFFFWPAWGKYYMSPAVSVETSREVDFVEVFRYYQTFCVLKLKVFS